ncbi:PSD1 domain-containing protein [Candidatus Poribacteria bacterium]|nr:PSD1 domain-containing protein [Candidatus Poribacteria bacterium]
MKTKILIPILFLLPLIVSVSNTAVADENPPTTANAELLFLYEVLPLLKAKCFACHGDDPDDVRSDFDIRSRKGMLKGGTSGEPALMPGDPENSQIYLAVTWEDGNLEMPPKENDRLAPEQIEILRKWIVAGAPWPNPEKRDENPQPDWEYADGLIVKTGGGLSEEWTNRRYKPQDLWGFRPVKRYPVPWEFLDDGKNGNPIDAFINRKLKRAGIKPAGAADKLTLIRRATFDLIGLPPTPEEIEAFFNDDSTHAFEKVIDRLLDSPHYGEQWGRHWLDVVRYADTSGFSNDFERPNAWRYRDDVIRSFNEDKPYNHFIIEQIAGDEWQSNDPDMHIPVGFLRMGPWEHTGMAVAAVTRQFFLDDITNSVGETFLSIPLRCARCHDHKFDPIPTRDYYRIQAVFAPVQFAEPQVPYLPRENQRRFEKGKKRIERLLKEAQAAVATIEAKEEAATRAWMEERGLKYLPKKERRKLPEDQRPPRFIGLSYQDLGVRKAYGKRISILKRQLDRYEPLAFSVYNGPPVKPKHISSRLKMPENREGDPQKTYILKGGSVFAPDEEVTPGVLSAVHGSNDTLQPSAWNTIPNGMDGRRLAFANWLANPNNSLTTRSIVNRIWGWHFGVGIAGNANNFGKMGKKPTHPQLLDWLATYFVEHGWSIKTLHRLIMTSQTYQRTGSHPDMQAVLQTHPDNKLLAYFNPRRLTAEELRDSMLFASGELNHEMGGFPIFPEINMEVAMQPRHIMGSIAPAYQPSPTPEERHRRTIYAYRYRGLPDPMLEVFNQPSAEVSCEQRTASTVTPQVFTLFNSQNSYDRALAMAHRLEQDVEVFKDPIDRAFKLAWGRAPSEDEYVKTVAYLQEAIEYHRQNPPVVQKYPTQVKRKMFEEMTGEPFEYTERLDIYEEYVPDLKPWDVGPETRALADLCLVLFNANEFIYVY